MHCAAMYVKRWKPGFPFGFMCDLIEIIATAMLGCDDVFDVKGAVGLMLLSQAAVLAAVPGAFPHLLPQRLVHAAPASFFL